MKDEVEAYEDEYYLHLPVDSGRIKTLLRHFDLRPLDTVCEIGCAAGHFLAEIAGDIESGIGLDTAEAAIAAANRRKTEDGLENIEFLQIAAQDFAAIEANVGQFDYVLLMDVTEHIDDAIMAELLSGIRSDVINLTTFSEALFAQVQASTLQSQSRTERLGRWIAVGLALLLILATGGLGK